MEIKDVLYAAALHIEQNAETNKTFLTIYKQTVSGRCCSWRQISKFWRKKTFAGNKVHRNGIHEHFHVWNARSQKHGLSVDALCRLYCCGQHDRDGHLWRHLYWISRFRGGRQWSGQHRSVFHNPTAEESLLQVSGPIITPSSHLHQPQPRYPFQRRLQQSVYVPNHRQRWPKW